MYEEKDPESLNFVHNDSSDSGYRFLAISMSEAVFFLTNDLLNCRAIQLPGGIYVKVQSIEWHSPLMELIWLLLVEMVLLYLYTPNQLS